MGLGNSFAQLLALQNYNTVIDISKLGADFPFKASPLPGFFAEQAPGYDQLHESHREAFKANLENKALSKKLLATHGGVNDEEISSAQHHPGARTV